MINKIKDKLGLTTFKNELIDLQLRVIELEKGNKKSNKKNDIYIDSVPDSQLEYVKSKLASIPKEKK